MARSSKRIRNKNRLGAYLAAGAGSLGMVSSAEAGVISINIGNTGFNIGGTNAGVQPGGYKGVYNFPTTGAADFYILNGYFGFTGFYAKSNIAFSRINPSPTSLKVFGSDTSIDNTSVFSGLALFKYNNDTAPDIGANKYLGFRFGSSGTYNYGYFELTWTSARNEFEIKSAAYESIANTPIFTPSGGGGGAVPEPASGAIAALLMGGTALRQWRKKQRQESNEAVAS